MVALIAVTMLAPFVIAGVTLAENADRVGAAVRLAIANGPPDPPPWVAGLPLVGESVAATWATFAHDTAGLLEEARAYIEPARKALLASRQDGAGRHPAARVVRLHRVLLLPRRRGDHRAGARRARAARRRARARLAAVATLTVRGVVVGILGTALAQGVLMAIGLLLVGIKAAPLLGLVTFFLSPVPIGPPLVWIPAGLWLLQQGRPARASSCCCGACSSCRRSTTS